MLKFYFRILFKILKQNTIYSYFKIDCKKYFITIPSVLQFHNKIKFSQLNMSRIQINEIFIPLNDNKMCPIWILISMQDKPFT